MAKSGRVTAAIAFAAICVVALVLLLRPGTGEKTSDGPAEKLTVGVANIVSSALFDVAASQRLFEKHGLDVSLIWYSSGLAAAEDLLKNKIDIATTSEVVAVTKHLLHPDIRILASIARPVLHEIIARKDRGINEPADLEGKRIAVTLDSSGDFFLSTFLAHQGIPSKGIVIVDMEPAAMPEALSSGKVDAAMTWEPTVGQIKERLGTGVVSWPGQSGQVYHILLVTRHGFVSKRSAASERLLRALIEAEGHAARHASESQDILAKRLGYNRASVQSLWRRCDFRVRLDQDLLLLMEAEAKWVIRHKRLKQEIPNYLDVVHRDTLRRIKPEAVSIID